jgi:hypothetical protein
MVEFDELDTAKKIKVDVKSNDGELQKDDCRDDGSAPPVLKRSRVEDNLELPGTTGSDTQTSDEEGEEEDLNIDDDDRVVSSEPEDEQLQNEMAGFDLDTRNHSNSEEDEDEADSGDLSD